MTERGDTLRTVVPGVGMIAVTFGLARYGYGLLLPDMQTALHVGPTAAGLIASGAYGSYLAANTVVVWLADHYGARLAVGLAAALAAAGMLVIATATGVTSLAVGVLVAGAAAGLAFPPYADVVARTVAGPRRAGSWSAISSGTGWGVALAGPVAIVLGSRWRVAWVVFAVLAVAVGVVAVAAAPAGRSTTTPKTPWLRWSWLVCPRSRPLLVSAVLIGAGSSVWWAFSVDALRAAGVAETPARAVYALGGAAGIVASATGAATVRVGLRRCYLAACVILTAALGLLGLATSTIGAVLVAAVLFGVSYNAVIAGQGLWNADVFAERPSAGLAAVSTALTIGTIVGPTVAGVVIRSYGYAPALLGAAVVVIIASLQAPPSTRRHPARRGPAGSAPVPALLSGTEAP